MKKKIYIIVGARPQIMKAASLARALDADGSMDYEIIHSGQHYDVNMSDSFFEELNLKKPIINFEIGSKRHNIFIAEFLLKFDEYLQEQPCDMVIVVGDTNTTAAAAIAASKLNIPLGHVEAGMREWNKSIPEEVNKLLTDSVSDLFFCPSQTAAENLVKSGVNKKVYITGDITYDLLVDESNFTAKAELLNAYSLEDNYTLATCHRAATTTDKSLLTEVINGLNAIQNPVLFLLHPRTKKALLEYGLSSKISSNVHCIDPTNYYNTQSLIRHADFVITDSGGIIKESYFHKTYCIIIDNQTEWVESVQEGWSVICGPNADKVLAESKSISRPTKHSSAFGDGQGGIRVIREIRKYLANKS